MRQHLLLCKGLVVAVFGRTSVVGAWQSVGRARPCSSDYRNGGNAVSGHDRERKVTYRTPPIRSRATM